MFCVKVTFLLLFFIYNDIKSWCFDANCYLHVVLRIQTNSVFFRLLNMIKTKLLVLCYFSESEHADHTQRNKEATLVKFSCLDQKEAKYNKIVANCFSLFLSQI